MDAASFIVRRLRPAVVLFPALVGCNTPPLTATDMNPVQSGLREGAPDHGRMADQRAAAGEFTSTETRPIARPQAPTDPAPYRRYPAPVVPVSGPGPAPVIAADAPIPDVLPTAAAFPVAPTPGFGPKPDRADTQLRVVAVVGRDVVITDDEVWQMVRQRAGEYMKMTGPAREAREKEMFEESLRTLIDRELILNDFVGKLKDNKPGLIDKLQEEARQSADKELDRFRKLNHITDEADFSRALRGQGMSVSGLRRQIERKAMTDIYLGQLLKEKKSSVTLAQVYQYYRENADDFRIDDEVKWLDLFVSHRRFATPDEAKKYAEQLQRQAASGSDFAALVKEHGHGDSVLRDGEGIGSKRGDIQPRELESTVFSLQSGQVSPLIPTTTGYHIVKVTDRQQAGVRPFDEETQREIRFKLAQEVAKDEYKRVIEDLWRKTTVRIVDLPK